MDVAAGIAPQPPPVAATTTLDVVVLVESTVVPRWQAVLLARLEETGGIRLAVSRTDDRPPTRRSPRPVRLYERLDDRLFRRPGDALEPVQLPLRLVHPPASADLVLVLAPAAFEAAVDAPSFGVWTVSHDAARWTNGRQDVVETRLEADLGDGRRRLLYRSTGAADGVSLRRSRDLACWKACAAIADRLSLAQAGGADWVWSRPLSPPRDDLHAQAPSAFAVTARAARTAGGVLARRALRSVLRDEWLVAVRSNGAGPLLDEPRPGELVPLEPPPESSYADPFLFEHHGETVLFVEEIDRRTRRGRLAAVRLDGSGRPLERPRTILERPYHLSYPFVFELAGETYLLPETAERETVELYRAVDFPYRWSLDRVLLQGLRAADPTLLEHDGRLWLFVTVAGRGASLDDDLHVFAADSLDGPWEPHPENPVVADVRSARPAGRLFVHGGRLLRPAQDCSSAYGSALVFNHVEVLTTEAYRETPVARIDPTWLPRLSATHTYSSAGSLEAIDGIRPRLVPRLERLAR